MGDSFQLDTFVNCLCEYYREEVHAVKTCPLPAISGNGSGDDYMTRRGMSQGLRAQLQGETVKGKKKLAIKVVYDAANSRY